MLLPELPAFSRVLKALPADAVDYKPHERTPMAQQIVWTLTNELQACVDVVTQNRAEWKPLPPTAFARNGAPVRRTGLPSFIQRLNCAGTTSKPVSMVHPI